MRHEHSNTLHLSPSPPPAHSPFALSLSPFCLCFSVPQEMVVSHESKTKMAVLVEEFQDIKTKFAVSEEMCKAAKLQVMMACVCAYGLCVSYVRVCVCVCAYVCRVRGNVQGSQVAVHLINCNPTSDACVCLRIRVCARTYRLSRGVCVRARWSDLKRTSETRAMSLTDWRKTRRRRASR